MYIYDNRKDFGMINMMIEYENLITLLEHCNKTQEYFALLQMIKSCNMSERFENMLQSSNTEYNSTEKLSSGLVWSENKSGVMVLDYRNDNNLVTIYISMEMLQNFIDTCVDSELKDKMLAEISAW